jgi:hypothetical protein
MTDSKEWPVAEEVAEVVAEILTLAAAALDQMGKLKLDSMANWADHTRQLVVAEVEVVAGTMAALAAVATGVHMVDGRAQVMLVVKQEILVPVGVLVIQMDLIPMVVHLVGNQEPQCLPGLDKVDDLAA